MEYRGKSEDLAIVTMLATSGVVCVWLVDLTVAGFEEGLLPLVMLGAAVGAAGAGYFVAPLFGRPGAMGVALAAIAALIATGLGGILGGVLVYFLNPMLHPRTTPWADEAPGLMSFALTSGELVTASLRVPLVGFSWLAMMVGIHLISLNLKR